MIPDCSMALAHAGYLFDKVFDPFGGVFNKKRFPENMTMAITQHGNMVLFSVIDWYTHDFCTVSGFFK